MRRSKPKTVDLKDIDAAVQILTERLGRGYSRASIWRRINSGDWKEGHHWVNHARQDARIRLVKINVAAVLEEAGISTSVR